MNNHTTTHMTTHEHAPHALMNRFDKLQFLQDTTAFKRDTILRELVGWLTDDDFDQFYQEFCQTWDVCTTPEQLNERYGS